MARVLLMATGLGRGGAETQLLRVGRGLVQRGHAVDVVSLIDRNRWENELAEWGLRYTCLHARPGRPNGRALVRFATLLARRRPDALGAFLFGASLLGSVSAQVARVPRVVTSVRGRIPASGPTPRLLRLTRSCSDAVVFNSQRLLDDAVARRLFEPARVQLIRNAIDTGPFDAAKGDRDAMRRELGIADGEQLWLAVGNVRPIKNLPAMAQAFGRLASNDARLRLVVVGTPYEDVEPMKAAWPALWESGQFQYLGLRRDVPSLMAAADVYVLPSLHEGSPNTVLEAMAASRPVLATAVGGVPEIVTAARGWLAATPDVDALERGMRDVVSASEGERRARAAAGHAYVCDEHATPVVVDRWESLLLGG